MSNKLKFGNGKWATKKGSTLAYNDENNNFKPLPFTTARDSKATRVNKEGLIEVVGNDVPRIDYKDNAKGALLLEPQSTNLATYSEDLTNGWSSGATSVISNQVVSPDGSLNADKLIESNTSARHELYGQTLSFTGTTSISFFAKASERRYISVFIGGDPAVGGATFDVQDGVVSLTSGGTNASIINHGNGWYRCSLTSTKSGSSAIYYCLRTNTNEVNVQTYQGDGTSGMYLWGFQTEIGQSYPTSYIPTNGSTATRLADTASGSGNSEVFNDSEGVLFADIQGLNELYRLGISENASTSNRILIGQSSSALSYIVTSGSTTVVNNNVSGYGLNEKLKIAAKYKQNDFAFWVNGFEVITVSSGNTPTNLNSLDLKGQGFDFYGKTKEIAYYDTALTDAELETLTSYRSLNELATELNLNTL